MSIVERLARMDREEVRFRLQCEIRKHAGRVRTALVRPAWKRERLARILNPNGAPAVADAMSAAHGADYAGAHDALARHFAARVSPFPLNAGELASRAALVNSRFPSAAADAAALADQVIRGRYALLGYSDLDFGSPPDWHFDPVHHRHSPHSYWASVPYLNPALGDHKVIWEVNRHQHWLTLGRAHALIGDGRYYEEMTRQLASWLDTNPPLFGINWASMLELAFRSLSWLWALEFFAGKASSAASSTPWIVDLLVALDRQLTHVEQNLSRYFSPNTHLSGEALALYVAGLSLPELASSAHWADIGRQVLVTEATRQVNADGGHAELSFHYHRYSTDFYLLALIVARRAGDVAAAAFENAARAQARFLRAITDDKGRRPAIGDDDGGQLFPITGRASEDCADTLATAAVLLGEPALAVGTAPEETWWLTGAAAQMLDGRPRESHWPSVALPDSGYFVIRNDRGDHLVFDAGPQGYLNGGHAHADALSFVLTVGGRPLLIDPGAATYTMDPPTRDAFRTTAMHNTLVVGGKPQAVPRGPFHWHSTVSARAAMWRSAEGCAYVEGRHEAYAPRRHTRSLLAVDGVGWWILDHLDGPGQIDARCHWHVHPDWTLNSEDELSVACHHPDGARTTLLSSVPVRVIPPGAAPLARRSPSYGRVDAAPVIIADSAGPLPRTIATFIEAPGFAGAPMRLTELPVETTPGDGWRGLAWELAWTGGHMWLLAAVEINTPFDGPPHTSAPPRSWGTRDRQTDARLALRIESASGTQTVIVNGRGVMCGATTEASEETHLLRKVIRAADVAPSVHESGRART
jgi:hypothetical protein